MMDGIQIFWGTQILADLNWIYTDVDLVAKLHSSLMPTPTPDNGQLTTIPGIQICRTRIAADFKKIFTDCLFEGETAFSINSKTNNEKLSTDIHSRDTDL
jgi:hypothetical protein